MQKLIKSCVLAAAAAGLLVSPGAVAREKVSGDQKLAEMLDGRVAGESRSCIDTFASRNMTVIDGTAVVFREGSTLWVNVPRNPEDLDRDDVWVTRTFGTQLCRLDQVTTYDRGGMFFNGIVMLGDFVPYRRVEG